MVTLFPWQKEVVPDTCTLDDGYGVTVTVVALEVVLHEPSVTFTV